MDRSTSTSRLARAATVLATAAVLHLTGCGDDTDAATGAEPSPAPASLTGSPTGFVPGDPDNEVRSASAAESEAWPACAEVWTAEGEIPADYRGCLIGDDAVVADRIPCSFGGSMTTFDDRYYGVVGAVVNDAEESLAGSRDYAGAYRQCTA